MTVWLLTAVLLVGHGGAYLPCKSLFHLPGDFIIGGLFPVHYNSTWQRGTLEPGLPSCTGLNSWGFSQFQAMRLAVEEINNSSSMLPNITLGYHVWDTCHENIYLQAALQLPQDHLLSVQGGSSNKVVAVVGPDEADMTLLTSRILTFYHLPQQDSCTILCDCHLDFVYVAVIHTVSFLQMATNKLSMYFLLNLKYGYPTLIWGRWVFLSRLCIQISYSAKDQRFTDQNLFPLLFRMVPNENHQIYGILSLIQAFDWKWVSAVGSGTKSSQKAIQTLVAEASARNICISYQGVMTGYDEISKIQLQRIVRNTVKAKTNVTIVFGEEDAVYQFFMTVIELNVIGKVWIAPETWVLSDFIASIPDIGKTGTILGLTIKPIKLFQFTRFVENAVRCSTLSNGSSQLLSGPKKLAGMESCGQSCDECHLPSHDLNNILKSSIWHWSFYSYAAIYAVAEALHMRLRCDTGACQADEEFEPLQLYELLYQVNFPLQNYTIKFSSQGDLFLGYDVLTWAWTNGTLAPKTIGSFSYDDLDIASSQISWATPDGQVPQSICITVCEEGQIRSKQTLDECSCRCEDCLEGTYPNKTYLDVCIPCPQGTWSPKKSDRCFPPTLTFLDMNDTTIAALLTLTIADFLLLCGCLLVFAVHWQTPVVKAAGGKLAFVMLGSLLACCATTSLFVGRPTPLTCLVRQPAFAISFTLCVSCLLVRSFQIIFIFKMACKLPMIHKYWLKYRGTFFFVAISSGVQAVVCFLWLFFSPPSLQADVVSKKETFLRCSEGHSLGLGAVLTYITLLCGACFVFAFWGRNLPKNYSEARLQTVSMLVFLMAWGCFMLIYTTTEGKGKQIAALQMFTVQTSVYAILCTFFLPKCYIILFKPQANTVAHFQTCIQAYTTTTRNSAK
uniref:taste receptor type 1 member 2-like n=1 Tax=Euleptes europaea TaxID=460621 RepID=UPI002540E21C|nr:taste receptor type 1 member 2-like [Euleptes europaea]